MRIEIRYDANLRGRSRGRRLLRRKTGRICASSERLAELRCRCVLGTNYAG